MARRLTGDLEDEFLANGAGEVVVGVGDDDEGTGAADDAIGVVEIEVLIGRIAEGLGRSLMMGRPLTVTPAAMARSRAAGIFSPSLLGPSPERSMTWRTPEKPLPSKSGSA